MGVSDTLAEPAFATSAAVICAVSTELLPNVVARGLPFHCTTAPLTKFDPLTVRVKAPLPESTVFGLSELTVGTGFPGAIFRINSFENPPPGSGFRTRTAAEPDTATSLASICAVSVVAFTNVVGRFEPLICTIAPLTKSDPVTVKVNAVPVPRGFYDSADEWHFTLGDGELDH